MRSDGNVLGQCVLDRLKESWSNAGCINFVGRETLENPCKTDVKIFQVVIMLKNENFCSKYVDKIRRGV